MVHFGWRLVVWCVCCNEVSSVRFLGYNDLEFSYTLQVAAERRRRREHPLLQGKISPMVFSACGSSSGEACTVGHLSWISPARSTAPSSGSRIRSPFAWSLLQSCSPSLSRSLTPLPAQRIKHTAHVAHRHIHLPAPYFAFIS